MSIPAFLEAFKHRPKGTPFSLATQLCLPKPFPRSPVLYHMRVELIPCALAWQALIDVLGHVESAVIFLADTGSGIHHDPLLFVAQIDQITCVETELGVHRDGDCGNGEVVEDCPVGCGKPRQTPERFRT